MYAEPPYMVALRENGGLRINAEKPPYTAAFLCGITRVTRLLPGDYHTIGLFLLGCDASSGKNLLLVERVFAQKCLS